MLLLEQGLGGPTARSSWKIRQTGGSEARLLAGFFSTGIPTSSYFLAASNGGLTARSSWKIRHNGGWDLGGLI